MESKIKRGSLVFVNNGTEGAFFGAKVLHVNKNSYRVQCYYGFPRVKMTVAKERVSLQDGQ